MSAVSRISPEGVARLRRSPALDILRIFAVGLVVTAHLLQRVRSPLGGPFGIQGFYWVTIGGVGVTLLIVLSGFVLEYSYGGRQTPYGDFVWRRFSHIYPTMWLSLLLSLCLSAAQGQPAAGGSLPWWQRTLDVFGLAALTGVAWGDLLLPASWFVGVIMSLYLLYPALSTATKRWPTVTLLATLVLSVAARLAAARWLPGTRQSDWFVLGRVFEFELGIWLASAPGTAAVLRRAMPGGTGSGWKVLEHLGLLSFAVYMVHDDIRDLPWLQSLHPALYLVAFLVLTVVAAEAVHWAARPIERSLRRTRRSFE